MNKVQEIVARYMNGQNGNALAYKLKENMDLIVEEIEKLPRTANTLKDDKISSFDRAQRIMPIITKDSRVVYFESRYGRTPRLQPRGDSITELPRAVRKALCNGWTEIDLRSSQFAILSERLNAPKSLAFIKEDKNIWRSFYQTTHGVYESPPDSIKAIYKYCLYGICFGMGDDKRKPILYANNLQSLQEHDIMQELLMLRAGWYNTINEERGAVDCWGEWIPLLQDRWEGSVAATVIQSIEMDIAKEMIVFADLYPNDMTVRLWLHDGCVVEFTNEERKEELFSKMNSAVMQYAKEKHNIITRLERCDL